MSLTLCLTNLQNTKKPGFFFPLKKKLFYLFFLIFACFLISMSRIICIAFYNIDWYIIYSIRPLFYYIYIVYNKIITFLLYFDHDRKYPNNSIRIGVDQGS